MQAVTSGLAVEYAGVTVNGCVRDHNEDRFGWIALDGDGPFITPPAEHTVDTSQAASDVGLVFAVADGLGGYGGGEVAAGLAVETSLNEVRRKLSSGGRVPSSVRDGFNLANHIILEAAHSGQGGRKMQSTLSALVFTPGEAHLGHVGDSRIYRRRDGDLELLTNDHSQVMELLRLHIITPEQAVDHPARYALTRSVGGDIMVRIDTRSETLRDGDTFLLCSDGLWSNVTSTEVAAAMAESTEAVCRRLVDLALERGGDDNATALAIRVHAAGERPDVKQGWRRLFS